MGALGEPGMQGRRAWGRAQDVFAHRCVASGGSTLLRRVLGPSQLAAVWRMGAYEHGMHALGLLGAALAARALYWQLARVSHWQYGKLAASVDPLSFYEVAATLFF